jgi:hypothetical protein
MATITTTLPTADRLARGDLARYMFGQKLPHKLRATEWPVYEAAKENGFLVVSGWGLGRVRLRNCYYQYCTDLSRPYVVVELRQKWASVELDMIEVPPRPHEPSICRRLSEPAAKAVEALLAELTSKRGAWWSPGNVFAYSNGIPAERAPWVGARLFAIACEDLRGEV